MSIVSGLSGIDIRPVDEASFSQVHPEGAGVTRRKRPSGFACFFSSSHRRKRDGRAVTRQPEGRGPSLHRGGANARPFRDFARGPKRERARDGNRASREQY